VFCPLLKIMLMLKILLTYTTQRLVTSRPTHKSAFCFSWKSADLYHIIFHISALKCKETAIQWQQLEANWFWECWSSFFLWLNSPSGPRPLLGDFSIILRYNTVGRTPLDQWSAHHRDLYLTKHNIPNRQTSMFILSPAGFEPSPLLLYILQLLDDFICLNYICWFVLLLF
jgi:hypothetical protein